MSVSQVQKLLLTPVINGTITKLCVGHVWRLDYLDRVSLLTAGGVKDGGEKVDRDPNWKWKNKPTPQTSNNINQISCCLTVGEESVIENSVFLRSGGRRFTSAQPVQQQIRVSWFYNNDECCSSLPSSHIQLVAATISSWCVSALIKAQMDTEQRVKRIWQLP